MYAREENEPIEEDNKKLKYFKFLMSIFLLLLFLSYFLLSIPLYDLLSSFSESKIIEGNTIFFSKFNVIFGENTYEQIKQYYTTDRSVEFVLCLAGKKEKDYTITELYQPEMVEQIFNKVSFKPCPEETLIVLHSHPNNRCIASGKDISMLYNIKNINNNSAIMIMCDIDRFSLYK